MKAWRLLLTRPEQECAVQAQQLAEHGIVSHCLPLLAIEPLDETPEQRSLMLDLDRYQAVIVVSKPAARQGLERLDRYWPQPPFEQHWFTVGAATGQLLADYGLRVHWPARGDDSEALLAHAALAAALAVPEPRALIIKGEGGRELLAESLRGQGVKVDTLEVYRRRRPDYPLGTLSRLVEQEHLDGLVVSSGQGLESLCEQAGTAWPDLRRLPLFVPSPRVAEMARALGACDVVDCRGAGTSALLAALRAYPTPAVP